MSIETWKAEFYPTRAVDTALKDAVQHSDMVNQDLELVVDFQFNGTYLGA